MDKVMLLAFFNNILDEEVNKVLKSLNVNGFSIIENVKGKGNTSGYHLGDNVFPDLNNTLIIVDSQKNIERIKSKLVDLKEKYKEEGIKIFILPVLESI
ncbi:conserved hypothetical protein [Thermotomaculum hydrothermale]|uniref:Nitrogen regulatory protein P-II n=1 Tax=Thermotomaculum hydrothermale TaxID=981385 RepID=A0A7R6PSR6_9BACT|nr:PG0541 family transporter-associated protein [Thermotomaculum hydrothermale]BBB31947.1 conserved hypothetical protein [Thermotomaculum hydrothermale]